MVQRKLGVKASTSRKTEKNPSTNMKPPIQNHDTKSKGAELSMKMKKSRLFKRSSDSETLKKHPMRRSQLPVPPKRQPPCSPMKQSPPRAGLSSSPNYMKSTSSSEARKEQRQVPMKTPSKSIVESASKKLLSPSSSPSSSSVASHKLSSRSLSRTSSLNKVRTLTKVPSFKPSRSSKSANKCSKAALCEDLDVKRATCSSTLKESKFPPFLDLNPGGTESEGTSVTKVCPYNYCSLNGHRHNANPPLKSFLSARRRLMKTQRSTKPVALSPCESKPCKDDGEGKEEVGVDLFVVNETDKLVSPLFNEEKPDFFIEVYVKEGEDKERVSLEPIGSKDNHDQEKEPDFALHEGASDGGNFDLESSTSISLDDFFAQSSDMEWEEEEGRLYLAGLEVEDGISIPSDQQSDHTFENPSEKEVLCLLDEVGVKKDDVNVEFLKEFLAEELEEFSQDEIIHCHEQFSDSESSSCDVFQVTESDQFLQDDGSPANEDMTEESSAFNEEITEASATEDETIKDSPIVDDQTLSTMDSTEEKLIDEEKSELFRDTVSNNLPAVDETSEDTPLIDIENSGLGKKTSPDSEEEGDFNLKKLIAVETVEATDAEELDRSTSEEEQPQAENKPSGNADSRNLFNKETSFNHEISNNFSDLNIIIGRRKRADESEALKSFNPREPNYLELEPDPEAEKVDLKHQEMDERRNSEEWMLDYALRKAVNQLAPARKRKVALLVEAFEKVIPPVHNCETHMRPISSGFARIQACN